ncbi:MAG: hypothetical protein IPN25_02585 [Sphingobacteriales bacterium]|nr:hypothetical protein [Sphingobacteriales bacterium]
MEATLICIGDELLIGQVVNTNASWMAEQLSILGFKVAEIIAIGDNHEDIKTTVDRALKKSQVVLITGGLGPTKDDLTKKCFSRLFWQRINTLSGCFSPNEGLFCQTPIPQITFGRTISMVAK